MAPEMLKYEAQMSERACDAQDAVRRQDSVFRDQKLS